VKPLLVSTDHMVHFATPPMVRFAHHNMVRFASLPSPQSNRRAVMRGMETPL
jgi:hypothetical protein